MTNRLLAIGLLSISFAAGCDDSGGDQVKPGQAPPPLTEQEKVQIKTEDEKVDAAEKANTPQGPATKRR